MLKHHTVPRTIPLTVILGLICMILWPIPTAQAKGCVAYDISSVECDTSMPLGVLSKTDIPDAYREFRFTTEHYAYSKAVFDSNWIQATNPSQAGPINGEAIPLKNGASIRLPKVGTYTDPQGVGHDVDAMLSIVDMNGGTASDYNGIFGIGISSHGWKQPNSYHPDRSKRLGATWRLTFSYSDGTPTPASFRGVTGFGDLDGGNGGGEGVELLSGFTGAYVSDETHLTRYGQNGWQGTDENNAQSDMATVHAQQHILSTTFSGPTIVFRYSAKNKDEYGSIFSAPLTQDQLVYQVNAKAVDQDGKTLKAWTAVKNLRTGGIYHVSHPDIPGYRYDRLGDGSAPESGSITNINPTVIYRYVRQCTVTWKDGMTGKVLKNAVVDCGTVPPAAPDIPSHEGYRPGTWDKTVSKVDTDVTITAVFTGLTTVLPDTGGHASHMPSIVGAAVTAAALALAVMARRRGGRHAV